ncbi:MAG: glutamate racemase [Spirochaetaceae bacterium]|nr:glutamate racemase [Spirochaetaceae bacterium]
MVNNAPIVVFDSGLGGISYLNYLQSFYNEKFIYVADSAGFPYGTKSPQQLTELLLNLIDLLKTFKPKAIVIACNTATLTAKEQIAQQLAIPVIGTRPPLAVALRQSINKQIGLLATQATINNPVLLNDITTFKQASFSLLAAPQLVEFVENKLWQATKQERLAAAADYAQHFLTKNIDSLILGCTHFLFLKEEFEQLLPDIKLIDSLNEVKEELARQLKLPMTGPSTKLAGLYTTNNQDSAKIHSFCRYAGLEYKGKLTAG